jgi:taurine transport system substrate-binding protein
MRKPVCIWKRLFAALVVLFFTCACSGPVVKHDSAPGTKKIVYGGSSWLGHCPVLVGVKNEVFHNRGLDVEFRGFDDSTDRMNALVAGDLDFATTGAISAISLMASGMERFYVVAMPDSYAAVEGIIVKEGIQSVNDLKDKTIAVTYGSSAHVLVLDILETAGMSAQEDVTLVNMKVSDMLEAFLSGSVDGCAVWTPTFNKILSQKGARLLLNDEQFSLFRKYELGPGPDLLVVRSDLPSKDPGLVESFLEGYFESIELLKDHPDKCTEILVEENYLSPEMQVDINQDVYWYDLHRQKEFMTADSFVWPLQQLADFLEKHGQIKKSPHVADWVRLDLLP